MFIWSFLKESFGRFSWVWFIVLLMGIWLLFAPSPFAQTTADRDTDTVYVLKLDDEIISPISSNFIQNGIEKARDAKAEAVVIMLDTPGGLLGSTHTIIKTILNAPMPVIVYVAPSGARAGSAGVFITMAGHLAAMAPTTHIGAAHPVDISGNWPASGDDESGKDDAGKSPSEVKKGKSSDVMSDKIMNDVIATMRGLAKSRGRNADWAVKAITESATLTANEAVEQNVVDLMADDVDDLLAKIDGRTVEVQGEPVTLEFDRPNVIYEDFSLNQKVLSVLTHPILAYLLLMIGFYGLLFEVTHPGFGVPGVVGIICLVLALIAMQAMSINLAGLGLIFIGMILFIAEVFTPSFGLLFGGGVLCLILGTLFLYQTGEPYLLRVVPYLVTTAVALAAVAGFLIYKVSKALRSKPLGPINRLIGQLGEVVAPIDPQHRGKIHVYGEIWDAESEDRIEKDAQVQVIAVNPLNQRILKVVKFVEEI